MNAPSAMLSINTGKHPAVTRRAKREWRDLAYQIALVNRLPKGLPKVRIDVELRFPKGARRDPLNYYPWVVKPIVDGFGPHRRYQITKGLRKGAWEVEPGWGLIPDDSPRHLEGGSPNITIGEPLGKSIPLAQRFGVAVVTITAVES